MKKILFAILCIAVMASMFVPATYAEALETEGETQTAINPEEVPAEGSAESVQENTETAQSNTYHTLFARIYEYARRYKTEIIWSGGEAITLIGLLVLRRTLKKKTSDMSKDVKAVRKDTSAALLQQESVVSSINEMIDGYNAMKEAYEKYETVEDDRNRLVAAVMAQNTALLDMLRTVYANSKNLPQGVKDTVMLEYANARKMLSDDEALRAVIDSVHEKINAGEPQDI
ncbi:MAG: hypothetical protein E7667_03470 [Ruminococcaceae bacterium]|nr:hypothetical protein [Oscillospiraceae bacterium]